MQITLNPVVSVWTACTCTCIIIIYILVQSPLWREHGTYYMPVGDFPPSSHVVCLVYSGRAASPVSILLTPSYSVITLFSVVL